MAIFWRVRCVCSTLVSYTKVYKFNSHHVGGIGSRARLISCVCFGTSLSHKLGQIRTRFDQTGNVLKTDFFKNDSIIFPFRCNLAHFIHMSDTPDLSQVLHTIGVIKLHMACVYLSQWGIFTHIFLIVLHWPRFAH